MHKPSSKLKPLVKTNIVFLLEGVLLPEPTEAKADASHVKKWLTALNTLAKKHPIQTYVVSGYTETVAKDKLKEAGLNSFFPNDHVFGVNEKYLAARDPVDRERYEQKCNGDPLCRDEYFRQVKMQELIDKQGNPSSFVLVGHDYWFDGFYTRRFSKVDIAFVETALSSRGKEIPEKIDGLWYVSRSFTDLKKIMEGKAKAPNYNPLDTWVNITLSEELFGGKGLPTLKRVVIQRKKDGQLGNIVKL